MTKTRISDAAKRVSDAHNLHRVASAENIGKWIACRLSDGVSDGVLYDSKSDAVRHQHHNEAFYAFVQIVPPGMRPREAQTLLMVQRRMYDAGLRLADRDAVNGGQDLIPRLTVQDQRAQIAALFGKGKPRNIIIPGIGRW